MELSNNRRLECLYTPINNNSYVEYKCVILDLKQKDDNLYFNIDYIDINKENINKDVYLEDLTFDEDTNYILLLNILNNKKKNEKINT